MRNHPYHDSKASYPDFDHLFGLRGEVHADGVIVDQVIISWYLVIEYGDRVLILPTLFFDTVDRKLAVTGIDLDSDTLPVTLRNRHEC